MDRQRIVKKIATSFRQGTAMRGYHDMGGLEAGKVVPSEHQHEFWEKRVDALAKVLQAPAHKLLTPDELRRHIESLGREAYEAMSYYERWMAAITRALLERGVITVDELGRKMSDVQARECK
jgi:hypothetical protein